MPRKSPHDQANERDRPARRVCYSVAMSLDEFIAGPNGEADWIVMDPDVDFESTGRRFDTMLMGRRTYEAMKRMGGGGRAPA
jgi:dihydrofolate reductase